MVGHRQDIPWGIGALLMGVTLVVALVAATLTGMGTDPWYAALDKPLLTPPGVADEIIWVFLFSLMAAGALLVAFEAGEWRYARSPAGLYVCTLMIHLAWRSALFGFHEPAVALVILIALWLAIFAMMQDFARYSLQAAWLQLPQLVWLTFCIYQGGFIWLANRAT